MHGFARLRLVGTKPIDGIEECLTDDVPQPLPFPTCVRNLPSPKGHSALDALEHLSFSFEKLKRDLDALATDGLDDGPRAA
ncbi:MAG: hypothetical protein LW636_08900 [Planctomycetaceae bacterium]|jgi:hypothetical protein|nr:hypothetical protein [Planctomycetaceae bacterium]